MVESATKPLVDAFKKSAAESSAAAEKAVTGLLSGKDKPASKKTSKKDDKTEPGVLQRAGGAIADGAKAVGDGVAGFVAHPGESISAAGDSLEKFGGKIGDSIMDFGKNLSLPGVLTGLLGVGGAFLIGSAFGGSFSWVITAMLAPMMFLLGNKFGKESVGPWVSSFADGSSKSASANGPQRQREYDAPHAEAPVVQQRGFNTTRANDFGQQLYDAGYMPPQRYAYVNDGYAPGYNNTVFSIGANFGNGWGFNNGWGGNRQWNSYNSCGPQWNSINQHGPSWVSGNSHGPSWVSSNQHGPQWNSSNQHGASWVSSNPQYPQWNQSGSHNPTPPAHHPSAPAAPPQYNHIIRNNGGRG